MKVGLLGLGTVGYGVYDIIKNNHYLKDVQIVRIFDRTLNKQPLVDCSITTNYQDLINDPSIDVIIDTLSNSTLSYDIIKESISYNKHVITASKDVMANHFDELMDLKNKNNTLLSLEATVGGGIPIINQLVEIVKTNKVLSIYGVLNGTTNFILTKIFEENLDLPKAIIQAQELGFAEKDPTSDLEGLDMVRKIAILSMIAFKSKIDISSIYHYSIANLDKTDIEFIKSSNYVLKYMASSIYLNNKLSVIVEPVLVNKNSVFATIKNEYNYILVNTNINGALGFYGKGAGRYPTANVIVNDLISMIEKKSNLTISLTNTIELFRCGEYQYYLNLKNFNDINKEIIEYSLNNIVITKQISREIFERLLPNLNFYARIDAI